MARVLLVLALTGCEAVLGLHEFEHPPPDAPVPALVTGHVYEVSVSSSAALTPAFAQRAYAASELALTAILDDGTMPPVDYHETDGMFTFERARDDQPYRLIATSPLGSTEVQLATPTVELPFRNTGRPDRVPVTKPTTLHFTYGTLPGYAIVASQGIATYTNPSAVGTGTFDLDWKNAGAYTAPTGLLDASKNDRLYYLQMEPVGAGSTTYYAVGHVATAALTLTDGVAQSVTAPLAATSPSSCAHVIAFRAEALARLEATAQHAYVANGQDWSIFATPSLAYGVTGSLLFVYGSEGGTGTDVDFQPTFYRPFAGGDLLASVSAGAAFNVTAPGASTPLLVGEAVRMFVPLDVSSPNCLANIATLATAVAMPEVASLGGVVLDHDGQSVPLPAGDVRMTWTSSSGPVQHSAAFVYELVANGTATTLVLRGTVIHVPAGEAILHREWFESGHTYLIAMQNIRGYQAQTGDFATTTWPYEVGHIWTHSFVVP